MKPPGEFSLSSWRHLYLGGVHPDYWRKGIAKELVNALCAKYRAKGIKIVRIGIDQRDKDLISFFESMGFGVGQLIDYSKTIKS